ncbi:hypothetical protein L1887_50175 [Cichorium endivia]|nr:hypothetical protein L1887_50175 [Cichorium endivia]
MTPVLVHRPRASPLASTRDRHPGSCGQPGAPRYRKVGNIRRRRASHCRMVRRCGSREPAQLVKRQKGIRHLPHRPAHLWGLFGLGYLHAFHPGRHGRVRCRPHQGHARTFALRFGYAVGPMFLSPLSEVPAIGRNWTYIPSMIVFIILNIVASVAPNYSTLMAMRFWTASSARQRLQPAAPASLTCTMALAWRSQSPSGLSALSVVPSSDRLSADQRHEPGLAMAHVAAHDSVWCHDDRARLLAARDIRGLHPPAARTATAQTHGQPADPRAKRAGSAGHHRRIAHQGGPGFDRLSFRSSRSSFLRLSISE